MRIDRCNNIGDFRSMARRRLPGPIFHYIDGVADNEVTYRRNTEAYERCDLVPNVLAGVESIDMSITVMGQKIDMPLFCAPTALQRLFYHDEPAANKSADRISPDKGRGHERQPEPRGGHWLSSSLRAHVAQGHGWASGLLHGGQGSTGAGLVRRRPHREETSLSLHLAEAIGLSNAPRGSGTDGGNADPVPAAVVPRHTDIGARLARRCSHGTRPTGRDQFCTAFAERWV